MFELESDTLAYVCRLYEQTQESLDKDVVHLKKWMQTQPHFPEIMDDHSIRNFLISNKFSMERSKQKIDMYYTLRTKIPDFYENTNPQCPTIKEVMDLIYWTPLPKQTQEKYRVFLFKMRKPEKIDRLQPRNVMALMNCVQEIRLREDVMVGDVMILDVEGLTLGYLAKITPVLLVKFLAVYEKVYSIPVKGVFIINSPPYTDTVLNIAKKLIKPKLFQRIHVFEGKDKLQELFPKMVLPKDYGGEEQSLEELHDLVKLKLHEYQDRFNLLDTLRVDENLRPEKLRNDEILGYYGNFKEINVD